MPVTRRQAAAEEIDFVYQPLDAAVPTSFRVVTLLPGSRPQPLSCTLTHEDRQSPVSSYESVSYFWGSRSSTKTIEVDGASLPVTLNLESALRHLRNDHQPRRLWVDAICINQSDREERAQQVRQMFQIYSGALQVIVWLGDDTPASVRAIEFINSNLAPSFESVGFSCSDEKENVSSGFWDEWDAGKDTECWGAIDQYFTPKYGKCWASIAEILCRPWWTRAWTVQELISAQKVHVVLGTSQLPWPLLDMTIQMMLRNTQIEDLYGKRDRETFHDAVEDAYAFAYERSHRVLEGPGDYDFEMLTQITRYRACHDARDKVFSIISLLPKSFHHFFDIDYEKPVARVYIEAVKSLIMWSRQPHILSSCGLGSSDQDSPSVPGLPSWVPDWGRPFEMSYLAGYSHTDKEYNFRASGESCLSESFSDDLLTMTLSGIEIDTINQHRLQGTDEEFEFVYDEAQPSIHPSCTWDLQQILIELQLRHKKLPIKTRNRETDVSKAFFSTLIVDRDPILGKRRQKLKMAKLPLDKSKRSTGKGTNRPIWPSPLFDFLAHARLWTRNRTLVLSDKGYIGLAPSATLPGDRICVLHGFHAPLILRPVKAGGGDGEFRLVGDAYVHSIMDGEAIKDTLLTNHWPSSSLGTKRNFALW